MPKPRNSSRQPLATQRDFKPSLQHGHRVMGAASTKRATQPKAEPDLSAALERLKAFLDSRESSDE